jgi:hypothetical protein
MTGSRVLFTATVKSIGGVNVIFSDELRTNIKTAIDSNCKDINAQCVEIIDTLLINPHTELETRQAALIVIGFETFAVIALLIPMLSKDRNEGVPVALHLPSGQLAQLGPQQKPLLLLSSRILLLQLLLSRGNQELQLLPGMFIHTRHESIHSLTQPRSDTPTQTTLGAAQDGHVPGGVAFISLMILRDARPR